MDKIKRYVIAEGYDKESFYRDRIYYGDWEGSCETCTIDITDEDECLVIDKKDLEDCKKGTLLFCETCAKKLVLDLFGAEHVETVP